MEEPNPYAPPAADVDWSTTGEPQGFWREGTMLVVARTRVVLPDRCVRCNAPAHGFRLSTKLCPELPGSTSLGLLGSFSNWLFASLAGTALTIEVGLCPTHRGWRRFGLLLLPLALLSPLLGLVSDQLLMPAFVIFVGGVLGGAALLRTVGVGRIDARHARLRVGVPFLLSVPRSPSSSER